MFSAFDNGIPSVFKLFGYVVVVAFGEVHSLLAGFVGKEPIAEDKGWDW